MLATTSVAGLVLLGVAAGYGLLALFAVVNWLSRKPTPHLSSRPPVSLLKPLCGAEPGLYEQLRSFCWQDYPLYQIVFGVRDPADPALEVVRRLSTEFPTLPIDVVVDPRLHGSNYKISNLINMLGRARYDVLIIADSDVSVARDYLDCVTAAMNDPTVGLVTCVYEDVPTPDVWSRLGAMYINEWYVPSALLAALFGHRNYASGQTLALRRATLEAIGGFAGMSDHLADDYRLGELVRKLGLRIELSPTPVLAQHHDPTAQSLMRHELRWMRTIRALRPRSFALMFLSFSLPLALLGLWLCAADPLALQPARALFGVALASRLGLYLAHRIRYGRPVLTELWLLPMRDLLLCWIWMQSFFSSRISWRGGEFNVDADGIMHRLS